jgi:hypothetical protein
MQKNSKQLENLKDSPFMVPFFQKDTKNEKQFEPMLNFALDEDYEEEEEEIIFNPNLQDSTENSPGNLFFILILFRSQTFPKQRIKIRKEI